jgi:hypothetical protein
MGYEDLDIYSELSFKRGTYGFLKKIYVHFEAANAWKKAMKKVGKGDVVFIQLPCISHNIFQAGQISQLKKKGVRVAGIIHDLETIRNSFAKSHGMINDLLISLEEKKLLPLFDDLIVHTGRMADLLHELLGIDRERLKVLGIFDYLTDDTGSMSHEIMKDHIVIAGNLKREKAGYLYGLPERPFFDLFGDGYEDRGRENVKCLGKFYPDELPSRLKGEYGLVWDGDSVDTCTSLFGEYLKINSPHKLSLYLASGIPVLIWDQAAQADFVIQNRCGFAISSLNEIDDIVASTDKDVYREILNNASEIGKLLKKGAYLKKALGEIGL